MELPAVPIENLDAFLTVVGQWNLYDMAIRGLRLHTEAPAYTVLEADLYLHADNVRRPAADAREVEYEFVFRFAGVEDLTLGGFGGQNIVGGYEFFAAADATGRPRIGVSLTGILGEELRLTCSAIAVMSVREVPVRRAS